MKSADKSLIAIVSAALLLVAVAFVVVLRRPPPAFETEDTASSVAHNYLLALQQEDYARAYGCLSPSLKGYPDSVEQFIEDMYSFSLDDDSVTLEIESSRRLGTATEAERVSVRETHFYRGGLFSSSQYSSVFEMELRRESGVWKIVTSDRYFLQCWTDRAGCR